MFPRHDDVASPTTDLPTERLEAEIVGLAARMAGAMCRWLLLVAEFDRREAYEAWECTSTAQWLSWRCAISAPTAREHVRVARALVDLPLVRAAFASGELSYSKVRAVVRAATPATEGDLVELAREATAAQLERLVVAFGKAVEEATSDETVRAREARRGVERFVDERGMHVYVLTLPPEEGLIVDKALEHASDVQYRERRRAASDAGEEAAPVPVAQRRADAMMRVIELGRMAALKPDAEVQPQYLVTLHVRPGDVSIGEDGAYELGNGVRLNPKLAKRLGCDALVQLAIEGDDETSSLNRGRTVRLATRDQRRAVLAKHHTCVFPACEAPASWCQMHHLQYWTDDGPTDLENLAPLCRRHHGAVHQRGWRLVQRPGDDRFDAVGPDGRYMWAGPPLAAGGDATLRDADMAEVGPGTAPWAGRRRERFDLDLAVIALTSGDPATHAVARDRVGVGGDVSLRC
jgi:hypothetical protein